MTLRSYQIAALENAYRDGFPAYIAAHAAGVSPNSALVYYRRFRNERVPTSRTP